MFQLPSTGHCHIGLPGILYENRTSVFCPIKLFPTFDISHHDMRFQYIRQAVTYLPDRSLANRIKLYSCLNVIIKNESTYFLRFRLSALIVMELKNLCLVFTKRTWIHVSQQTMICRDKEAINRILRIQIHIIIILVDSPIDDIHRFIDQCRERYGYISHRTEHLICQIDSPVTSEEHAIHIFLFNLQFIIRIIQHCAEFTGNRIGKRIKHVYVQ